MKTQRYDSERVIKSLYACNKSGQIWARSKREGRQAVDVRGKKYTLVFFLLKIPKYISTIVNLGIYISLGNRENRFKCISAFVYTFRSKELHKFSSFIFFFVYRIDMK